LAESVDDFFGVEVAPVKHVVDGYLRETVKAQPSLSDAPGDESV